MTATLQLVDLQCRRGDRVLFSGVSAAVAGGQLLRVHGDNGAGKTSLLRLLCGLGQPDAGSVLWQGQPIAGQREEFHTQLLYLGHAPALKGELTALENLQAAAGLAGQACATEDAMAALAQAGLRGRERLPLRVLSQGQRKRAALARLVLVPSAALWVLDEPFDALDDTACQWLQCVLGAQLARGGIVVLTSHQQRVVSGAQPPIDIKLQPPPRRLRSADALAGSPAGNAAATPVGRPGRMAHAAPQHGVAVPA